MPLTALFLTGLLVLLLGPIAWWATPAKHLQGKDKADARNSTRQTLLAAVGGLVVLTGAAFTARTFYLTRRGQFTDRYTTAIGQLASDSLTERLGGIYALEHLMVESERDHETVVEVLAAFIREHARPEPATSTPIGPVGTEHTTPVRVDNPQSLRTDIQATLTVLGRRPDRPERNPINLAHTDLQHADLVRAQLQGANLSEANLRGAHLSEAQLQGANLSEAQLQGANLSGAQLQGADLSKTQLRRVDLMWANLRYADLMRAQLQGANLMWAPLQGANLIEANLRGAHLMWAQLQGANLSKAQLQGANLSEAQLQDAILLWAELQGANLSEANLRGAHLSEAQLQGANLSEAQLRGVDLMWAESLDAN